MIRNDNQNCRLHTQLWATVGILLLVLGSASFSIEANAAQKSAQHANSQIHWGYEPDNGPGSWGKLNKDWQLCAEGEQQSPIDLTGARQKNMDMMKLEFPTANLKIVRQTHVLHALDNGHTIQINYDSGETLEIGGHSFALRQYHFHSPSEHTVNGRRYPMEMHLVHLSQNKKIAVIGVFIEQGRHNEAFDRIWSNLPTQTGQEVHIENVQVDIDHILPENKSTYRYRGSLTTPPCSEGVGWFVYVEPIELSREQIEAFQKIFHGNNRPIQPLNDRTLWYDGIEALKE
ncbi:Carbonic anhydrase, alpha class (EC [Olavius algarvensis Delta 1 endosymbiont]|nr:Carbonic anhydrase, alpha class (EC [Olavius algarvensis Delta 1 endosymbiont]